MRVAVWTPLPPDPSGIADYNAMLLGAMAREPSVTFSVVVRDDARVVDAPAGVAVVHVRDYRPEDVDIDLFHVGNNPTFHGYMFPFVLERRGVVVLHDPAIADLMEVLLGGRDQRIFEVEVAENIGCAERDDERLWRAIGAWNRTDLLLSRRIVTASATTLVHSRWAAAHLRARFGDVNVHAVPFAVAPASAPAHRDGPLTFGVFGNLSFHKRVPAVVAAFAEARRRGLDARLLIAGRRDSAADEHEVATLIDRHDLGAHVRVALDASASLFRALEEECDVVVGLRWPTAGETSASLLECFARAKAAIVSDIPQNDDFSDEFCWRVSVDLADQHEQLVAAMLRAGADPAATRRAGRAALAFVTRHGALDQVAATYLAQLRAAVAARARHATADTAGTAGTADTAGDAGDAGDDHGPTLGVNVIASWAGATGLAEAGRRSALALLREGVAIATTDVNLWAKVDESRVPPEIAALPHGHPFDIAVSFLNVNEFHVVEPWQLRGHGTPYLIAMWYWELPALPRDMIDEIARVDEIWVASAFVRDVFLRYTTKPIHVMPCVVEPVADPRHTRESLGLPGEDVVVYLVTFDANSTIARKNPYGAIKAFEEAFGTARRDVQLVVKVINLADYPVVRRDLRAHVARLGGILIESDMAPGEIAALIKHSDVYVSLHRSEGFGLGMAEAMYFARPVIGTANSGNMDFMNAANSCLVSYRSMVVHRNELMDNPTAMTLYQPGNLWVDPDVHEAARLMRWLFEHPDERARLGARAAADIREGFSSAAAGRAMRARLGEVAAMLEEGWTPVDDVAV